MTLETRHILTTSEPVGGWGYILVGASSCSTVLGRYVFPVEQDRLPKKRIIESS